MAQKTGALVSKGSDLADICYQNRAISRTKVPTILIAARFATIRRLLAIVLESYGYSVLEADHWNGVGLSAAKADIALVMMDADQDHFSESRVDQLDENGIARDVPVIVLTDEEPKQGGRGRPVINMAKVSTVESIVLMVQALTLGRQGMAASICD